MQTDTDKIREKLLAVKADLQKRVDRIHHRARDPLNADSAEQAAELGNVQVVAALESEAIHELTSIEDALHRLAAGNYGICASCGEANQQGAARSTANVRRVRRLRRIKRLSAPAPRADTSAREQLLQVAKALELERIAGRIPNE